MNSIQDFGKHLTRQIGYLQRSCQSYDKGFKDESIRIATVIRVLIHETPSQYPLLRHLDAMHIKLATTCNGPSEHMVLYDGMGIMVFRSSGAGEVKPDTSVANIKRYIPVDEWWSQTVHVGSGRHTRRSLVLAAANKDGGAHVDKKLTPEYESLLNRDGQGFWSYGNPRQPDLAIPTTDAPLAYLRQMGFELLNSPELLALTT